MDLAAEGGAWRETIDNRPLCSTEVALQEVVAVFYSVSTSAKRKLHVKVVVVVVWWWWTVRAKTKLHWSVD